jgi:hypothetical protein
LKYGIDAGIVERAMKTARKVTVELPADLLRRAQKSSGDGVTATIRKGLELVAAGEAYRDLRRLKGKVSFSIDLESLRDDGHDRR